MFQYTSIDNLQSDYKSNYMDENFSVNIRGDISSNTGAEKDSFYYSLPQIKYNMADGTKINTTYTNVTRDSLLQSIRRSTSNALRVAIYPWLYVESRGYGDAEMFLCSSSEVIGSANNGFNFRYEPFNSWNRSSGIVSMPPETVSSTGTGWGKRTDTTDNHKDFISRLNLTEINIPICYDYDSWKEFVTAEQPDWNLVINKPNDYIDDYDDYYIKEIYNIENSNNQLIDKNAVRFQWFTQQKINATYLYRDDRNSIFDLTLIIDSLKAISKITYTDEINGKKIQADSIKFSAFVSKGTRILSTGNTVVCGYFETNIPIFSSKEAGDRYRDAVNSRDEEEIERAKKEAENFDSLEDNKSGRFKDIGDEIIETPLNDGYMRTAFVGHYLMDYGVLGEIGSKLFSTDTSIIDEIKKGLELYGANPMDVIIDLTFYPFNIREYLTYGIQTSK